MSAPEHELVIIVDRERERADFTRREGGLEHEELQLQAVLDSTVEQQREAHSRVEVLAERLANASPTADASTLERMRLEHDAARQRAASLDDLVARCRREVDAFQAAKPQALAELRAQAEQAEHARAVSEARERERTFVHHLEQARAHLHAANGVAGRVRNGRLRLRTAIVALARELGFVRRAPMPAPSAELRP